MYTSSKKNFNDRKHFERHIYFEKENCFYFKSDKGNTIVVLNREDYFKRMVQLMEKDQTNN